MTTIGRCSVSCAEASVASITGCADASTAPRGARSARIVVAGDRLAVLFTPRTADAAEDDYVRFALHYYARVLFELVRTARSPRDLPTLIDRIASARLTRESDLFALTGTTGELCRSIDDRLAVQADCVLSGAAHREFHLRGDFSRMNSRMLIRSVLAVVSVVIGRVSPEMADVLVTALANMNASYGVTHRYSDTSSLDQVPATAFHAASFV